MIGPEWTCGDRDLSSVCVLGVGEGRGWILNQGFFFIIAAATNRCFIWLAPRQRFPEVLQRRTRAAAQTIMRVENRTANLLDDELSGDSSSDGEFGEVATDCDRSPRTVYCSP